MPCEFELGHESSPDKCLASALGVGRPYDQIKIAGGSQPQVAIECGSQGGPLEAQKRNVRLPQERAQRAQFGDQPQVLSQDAQRIVVPSPPELSGGKPEYRASRGACAPETSSRAWPIHGTTHPRTEAAAARRRSAGDEPGIIRHVHTTTAVRVRPVVPPQPDSSNMR